MPASKKHGHDLALGQSEGPQRLVGKHGVQRALNLGLESPHLRGGGSPQCPRCAVASTVSDLLTLLVR